MWFESMCLSTFLAVTVAETSTKEMPDVLLEMLLVLQVTEFPSWSRKLSGC